MVELLAVIVIVGILATVGVIAVTNIISNSENKALVEEGLNLAAAGRYAYENNDNLAGSNKVCISLETLNETGYYEKGKSEDYAGSVLITNNDGKITTTFWINKENSKYIEGASLTATEDNVIKETKLKYENKESLNNGSFCNFKTDAEKNSVNVGTKDNLDEYDGKTPISITVNDDSNLNINVQNITCRTDSESGNCPNQSGDVPDTTKPQNPANIPTTGTNKNEPRNYLVFANDSDHNLFRKIDIKTMNTKQDNGTTKNISNLIQIVQNNYASIKQMGYLKSKYTNFNTYDYLDYYSNAFTSFDINDPETKVVANIHGNIDYKKSKSTTNTVGADLYIALTKEEGNEESYIKYLKSVGINIAHNYIPRVEWKQKRCYIYQTDTKRTQIVYGEYFSFIKPNLYSNCGTVIGGYTSEDKSVTAYNGYGDNFGAIGILSIDDYINTVSEDVKNFGVYKWLDNHWLTKGESELLFDIGGCDAKECDGNSFVIGKVLNNVTTGVGLTQVFIYEDPGIGNVSYYKYQVGHIRPSFFLTPDKNKIYPPKGITQSQWGTKDHPYIIVQE